MTGAEEGVGAVGCHKLGMWHEVDLQLLWRCTANESMLAIWHYFSLFGQFHGGCWCIQRGNTEPSSVCFFRSWAVRIGRF